MPEKKAVLDPLGLQYLECDDDEGSTNLVYDDWGFRTSEKITPEEIEERKIRWEVDSRRQLKWTEMMDNWEQWKENHRDKVIALNSKSHKEDK
jgi:hypothetical protein